MNDVLTQQEADQLVGKSWPEILAAKARLAKLDERQAELACLEEHYQAGRRINVLVTDGRGLVGFAHRAEGDDPFIDQVLSLCALQLLHERSNLFKSHALPEVSWSAPALPAPAGPASVSPPPADPAPEWLSARELATRANIVYEYVSSWAKNNGFLKKRNGKSMLYAAPPGFRYK